MKLQDRSIARWLTVVLLVLAALCAGCWKPKPLPEPESPGALAYVARCAVCHVPYHPSRLTPKMWESMMPLMEGQMAKRGMPPLESAERALILEYLSAHAATQ